MEIWKKEKRKKGNMEIWKHRNSEIGKYGNMEKGKYGNKEIWKYGNMEETSSQVCGPDFEVSPSSYLVLLYYSWLEAQYQFHFLC